VRGPRGRSGFARAFAGLVVLTAAWVTVSAGLRLVYVGEVLPRTRVGAISIGGMSEIEVRRRLASVFAEGGGVTVVDGPRRFGVRASEVAFRIDAAATAARAMRAGRDGPLAGFGSDVTALVSARDVRPVYTVNRRRLSAVVAGIALRVDRPPFRGGLSIDPDRLRVDVVAPRRGRVLNRAATSAAMLAALRRGDGRVVRVRMRRARGARLRDVQAVARRARGYLAGSLRLSGFGDPVTLSPRRMATMLHVSPAVGAGDTGVRLGADPRRATALIDALAARRDRAPVNARVIASGAAVTVDEQLDLSWTPRRVDVRVVPARPGRRLRQATAVASIDAAVRESRHAARLAVRSTPAVVPTVAARAARRLIGTFTTRFECCQPRVTNIRLIARAVDGTVIAPGEKFSLNDVAGRRTRAKGYVPAPFISDGKLVPSVGGGVSQFSTTIYNAVYFAGLRIDKHQPHSVYIARYPPGREATLDYGSIDLTWTNDTGIPVFVRASSTSTSVTVSLYGDNGGRRVRSSSGSRQPLTGRDFSVTVTRRIRYADGRVVRQPFTTTYDKPPANE